MNLEQRYDLRVTCTFCGHDNHLAVAAVSLPDNHVVNCSACGGAVGTIAQIKTPREVDLFQSPQPADPPGKRAPSREPFAYRQAATFGGNCWPGVEVEIASSSGVMSAGTSAKSGVER